MTLAETHAAKITPFPFAALPRCEAARALLEAKLRRLHTLFFADDSRMARVEKHLDEIFKTKVSIAPAEVTEMALEEIVTELPGRFIGALVRLDPHAKRAFMIFEQAFAHELSHAVLAGNTDMNLSPAEMSQPMTALSEAAVEYAVLGFLAGVFDHAVSGNLSPVFEDIVRDAKRLLGLFSHHDRFAVFSFMVKTVRSARLVRVVIPLAIAESFDASGRGKDLPDDRRHGFADFRVDFQLSAGGVTLDENEVKELRAGDIVLLDECSAEFAEGKLVGGSGWLRPVGCDAEAYRGFEMRVRVDPAGIQGTVVGAG